MADVLTEAELAALAALREKSGTNPWVFEPEYGIGTEGDSGTLCLDDDEDEPNQHQALAIAAVNALPRLIATVRALRAELDGLRRRA